MGLFHSKETARQTYIRLFRERVDALDSLPPDQRTSILYAELIAGDYLKGVTRTDEHGVPNGNVILGVTVKGRLFMQELAAREKQDSWLGRAKKFGFIIVGFVMGIVSHLLPDLLKSFLSH